MKYGEKDLEGKLQEDLEILDRLTEERKNIVESNAATYNVVPTASSKNRVAEVNKSFIDVFKEKIQIIKDSFKGPDDTYSLTKEEEKKLTEFEDPINRMDMAAKKLVRKYPNRNGSLESLLIIAVTSFSIGMILALIFAR